MHFTGHIVALALCAAGHADASVMPHQHLYRRGNMAEGDSRSPCPALNTLANHGILPRNGKSITPSQLENAVKDTYNIDSTLAYLLGHGALPLITNTTAEFLTKNTLDLSELSLHDGIEHDASLSRNDFSQGDNHSLQQDLVAALLADSPTDSLTVESVAKSRARREKDAAGRGAPAPSFKVNTLAYGEAALLLLTLSNSGNETAPLAPKKFVQSWVGEEKLPDGWTKPVKAITISSAGSVSSKIQDLAKTLKK